MKRVLTIQDISCLGQCSLTVALPIISATGVECCVLPTAVLSTHTGGFSNYTFLDLSQEMDKITEHWRQEKITFDCIYTGYLGSIEQIGQVSRIFDQFATPNTKIVIDPVMADNGKLYAGFSEQFAEQMAKLIEKADVIVPNITEACFLLGKAYQKEYDADYIKNILDGFSAITKADVVLTGVSYSADSLGVSTRCADKTSQYFLSKIPVSMHGTGDVYASCLVGALMQGYGLSSASALAADFTVECIKKTLPDKEHWYGVEFEKAIPYLVDRLFGVNARTRSASQARVVK